MDGLRLDEFFFCFTTDENEEGLLLVYIDVSKNGIFRRHEVPPSFRFSIFSPSLLPSAFLYFPRRSSPPVPRLPSTPKQPRPSHLPRLKKAKCHNTTYHVRLSNYITSNSP